MDQETLFWMLKYGGIIVSAIVLFIFKRRIIKVVSDIIVGGDTTDYVGKSVAEISNRIRERMDEVLR